MANSQVGINIGSATSIASDLIGSVNYGISKIDISPIGASGTLFNGTVGISSIPQVSVGTLPNLPQGTLGSIIGIGSVSGLSNLPGGTLNNVGTVPGVGTITNLGSITNVGTLGTATGIGSVGGLGTLPGVGVVTNITNLLNGTIQNSGTVTGVGVVTSLTNGSVNIPNGTLQALGTMGTLGTVLGIGSIANIGTINNAGTINAGTINTGTINTGTFVYTGGTLNLIGTTQFIGTLGTLQSIGTLPNLPGGSIVVTNGTMVQTTGTINAGTINAGTFQNNPVPTSHVTNYGTQGTAGAGTAFGTIQGTVGSGTEIILSDISIVAIAGTPTVSLGWGTQALPFQGTGAIEAGLFPAGGGIAKAYDTANHSGTNGILVYGITGGTAFFKVGYQVVATTI